jgi:hypothetical protein
VRTFINTSQANRWGTRGVFLIKPIIIKQVPTKQRIYERRQRVAVRGIKIRVKRRCVGLQYWIDPLVNAARWGAEYYI